MPYIKAILICAAFVGLGIGIAIGGRVYDNIKAERILLSERAARDNIQFFVSREDLSKEDIIAARSVLINMRNAAAREDSCVVRWAGFSLSPREQYAQLLADQERCSLIRAAMADEASRCSVALRADRCHQLVRAWYCLHEDVCTDEAETARAAADAVAREP